MEENFVNLATYYVLPQIEMSKSYFGRIGRTQEPNFVNCYITDENFIAVEVAHIEDVPVGMFQSDYYFTDFPTEHNTSLLLFRVSGASLPDVIHFRNGCYSKFSTHGKLRIERFSGLKKNDVLIAALYKDPRVKARVEEKIGQELEEGAELVAMPHSNNFIDITTQIELSNDEE